MRPRDGAQFPIVSHDCFFFVETPIAPYRARVREMRVTSAHGRFHVRADTRRYRGSPHTGAAFRPVG
jgi:hypothetical protein